MNEGIPVFINQSDYQLVEMKIVGNVSTFNSTIFKTRVAKLLDINYDQIDIKNITAGSVIVLFNLFGSQLKCKYNIYLSN